MGTTKFVLIFFLFLWGANVCAQEVDLFEDERAYKMVGGNTGFYRPIKGAHSLSDMLQYRSYWDIPDTLNIEFKRIEVSSFHFYFDESVFDSTFGYYNTSNFDKLLYRHHDSLETQYHSNMTTYYKLFRKVYGVLQGLTPIKREILSFRDSVFRVALLTCEASFNGIEGRLNISLNITKKEKPLFAGMDFTSYDYSEVPFFTNISGLSLEYIKTQNITSLKKEASEDLWQRILNKKKLAKSLEVVNCDSLKQFTSNLIFAGNSTYARVVYDMLNEHKYLALVFISENKKFKLHDLGFIDKKRK